MSTLARLSGAKNSGSTFASLSGNFYQPAYAATIALLPPYQAAFHLVKPAALTGAVTFTAPVGDDTADDVAPFVGDVIAFLLQSDTTSRVVTFGTGFASTGTLSVTTAKYAYIEFIFNGLIWQEKFRTVTA